MEPSPPLPFTPSEMTEVQDFVSNRVRPLQHFLSNPLDRGGAAAAFVQIPVYIELIHALIHDYTALETYLPREEVFLPTLHTLDNLREQLIVLEERGPIADQQEHPGFVRTESGQHRYDVDDEEFINLFNDGFDDKDLSELLGVTKRWVKRTKRRLGLSRESSYTRISDEELIVLVVDIKENGGHYMGEVGMAGALKEEGIKVPRQRLRDTLAVVDREGVLGRWLCTVKRRRYSVPFVNSLWHIDGTVMLHQGRVDVL
ncbi:hypothetical protein P7C70_g8906, partial [Phenoliferia sp. Uapishka_3]